MSNPTYEPNTPLSEVEAAKVQRFGLDQPDVGAMTNEELIAEARKMSEGWDATREEGQIPYRPFDQGKRIRHWTFPWETDAERAEFDADVEKWEDVHGHDVRLKCYPEFQCAVIESYSMDVIIRLADALAAVPAPTEADREVLHERIVEAILMDSNSVERVEWLLEHPQNPQTHKASRLADAILPLIEPTPVPAPKTQDGEARTVSTPEELDALGLHEDSVIRGADGFAARLGDLAYSGAFNYPVTVLYVPVSPEGGETK